MASCTLNCRVCGGVYDLPAGGNHGACPACGTENCRPQAEGEALDKLRRANRLRLEGDYAEALKCYSLVLVEYEDEHEALWGKLLCQYGVSFVTDPRTGGRYATVHVPHSRPMQLQSDFRRACELAPEEIRAQYEAEAAYVDAALAEINRRKESSPPYDVFLCHKTTQLDGPGYTEDYNRSVQIYMKLQSAGYRVFFAPFAGLEAGASYEAGIYFALWSARVMLLIASDASFLTSPWVRSEWTRYLEMLDDGQDKHLVPLMYGLPESRLPREIRLRGLQSIRMEDLDAAEKLMAAVTRYAGPKEPAAAIPAVAPAPAAAVPTPVVTPVRPEPPAAAIPPAAKAPAARPEPPAQEADLPLYVTEPAPGGVRLTACNSHENRIAIPDEIGGAPVVEIGEGAFRDCGTLTNVAIPRHVTVIGDYAFAWCSGLKEAILPQGLTAIGAGAFQGCRSLNQVKLPGSLTTIGPWAFQGCAVASMTIPEGVTSIGENAFTWCSRLLSVDLPASLTALGFNSFGGCGMLAHIHIDPANHAYTSQDSVVFSRSGELVCYPAGRQETAYAIPDGVVSIADWAFSGCGRLTSLRIPETLSHIAEDAFHACPNLTLQVHQGSPAHVWAQSHAIPYELTGGAEPAFFASAPIPAAPAIVNAPDATPAAEFETREAPGGVAITGYTGMGGKVVIPATIGGQRVVAIGDAAFENCDGLTEIVIPEGVTAIGDYAFSDCGDLASVVIPQSVTSIGKSAFYYTALTALRLPERLTHIAEGAFTGCAALTEVVIPPHVRSIGRGAFDGCAGLTAIVIPADVSEIGDNPFSHCAGLQSLTVSGRNTMYYALGDVLFSRLGQLVCYPAGLMARTYTLPDRATSIGAFAFAGCAHLTSVTIPESVTAIGQDAFIDCSSLASVTLPRSVREIGAHAFRFCTGATLHVQEGSAAHTYAQETQIPFALLTPDRRTAIPAASEPASCSPERHFRTKAVPGGLAVTGYTGPGGDVVIPASIGGRRVVEIGGLAFNKCDGLTAITLPEGVTRIQEFAFAKCSALTDVTLPDSVMSIGRAAFDACTALQTVTIPANVVDMGGNPFRSCTALARVNVSGDNQAFYTDGHALLSWNGDLICYFPGARASAYAIPEDVNRIGEWAFHECSALETLTIHEDVTEIGWSVFFGCKRLTLQVAPGSAAHAYAQEKNLRFILTDADPASVVVPAQSAAPAAPAATAGPVASPEAHFTTREVEDGLSITGYTGPGGDVVIPASIGGKAVRGVAAKVFSGCAPLQSVVIPGSMTGVGYGAFMDCTTLRRVTIHPGVSTIGFSAFKGCTGLQEISLPEGLVNIGLHAFCDCASLTALHIPASVTSIQSNTFVGCTALQGITVAADNPEYHIRDQALLDRQGTLMLCLAASRTEYDVPEGVKTIGYRAFSSCQTLRRVNLPLSVTKITGNAFDGCASLEAMTIPASVTEIGPEAFDGCRSLVLSVHEGSAAHAYAREHQMVFDLIGVSAPSGPAAPVPNPTAAPAPESHFRIQEAPRSVTITGYKGPGGDVVIPASIGGKPVVAIGLHAFAAFKTLRSIVIPQGVEKLWTAAFMNCVSLTAVTLPRGLATIGSSAFEGCIRLQEITIPDGVTLLGEFAFKDCTALQRISLPASAERVGAMAFSGCTALQTIGVDPENPAFEVRDGALISRPDSTLRHYPTGAPAKEYAVPEGVTAIGSGAFSGCQHLRRVHLPQGLLAIGDDAFHECPDLLEVNIPASVTSFGKRALGEPDNDNCPHLTLRVQEGTHGHVWAQQTRMPFRLAEPEAPAAPAPAPEAAPAVSALPAAEAPDQPLWSPEEHFITTDNQSSMQITAFTPGMSALASALMAACSSVTITGYTGPGGSVLIPPTIDGKRVTDVGDKAFENCAALTRVEIPEGVTTIGKAAFKGCTGLTDVHLPESLTAIGSVAFFGCSSLAAIHIPSGLTEFDGNPFSSCTALRDVTVSPENPAFEIRDGMLMTREGELVCYPAGADADTCVIPADVRSISSRAFCFCPNLRRVFIPHTVAQIGDYAFFGCSHLTLHVHENSAAHLHAQEDFLAFEVIPDAPAAAAPAEEPAPVPEPARPAAPEPVAPAPVPEPPKPVFPFATRPVEGGLCITKYKGHDETVRIPSALFGQRVVEIGPEAFRDYTALTAVDIPSSVRFIGRDAFRGCRQLTAIVLPDSVSGIGAGAFSGCSSLKSVTLPARMPALGAGAFDGCPLPLPLRLKLTFAPKLRE